MMKRCESCNNQYDKAFDVILNGKRHVFDSFQCAINRLAPRCTHCGSLIIGHGVETSGTIFCCAHCARQEGRRGVKDRDENASYSGAA